MNSMVNIAEKVFLVSLFGGFVFTCTGKLALKNVITYKELVYTKYQSWNLRGELRFLFKTTQKNGLLVYQDDGSHNFMDIFLVEGNVRLKARLGSCDIREIFISQNFSDGFWHQLRIKSYPKNFTLLVDDKATWIPCGLLSNQKFKYGGNFLYIANFPLTVELNALVFPGAYHEAAYPDRFQGCIGDVRSTNYKGNLHEATIKATSGVSGCVSACATLHANKCQHRGKCVDEIGRVECECTGTGYEGPLCSKPTSAMWLDGSGYILYDVGTHQPGRSTVGNNIAFRFATTSPWGVVMLTDIADDHVVVELVNGFLRVSWDLGQGGLVLMSRHGCLHDAVWHAVTITRLQRRIKITVDDQRPIHATIPGKFSFLDFKGGKEQMLFGGGPLTKAFNRSLSRTNFTGFLQQFQFDEFDVIDETILGKAFTLLGNGVLNASSLFDQIPASPSFLANCSREVDPGKERHCREGIDDEDWCESAESGDGPVIPDCGGNCTPTTTDDPAIGSISPNHNSTSADVTSSNMTSMNTSSVDVTSLNVTSQVEPSLSLSTNTTEIINTAVITLSHNETSNNASINSTRVKHEFSSEKVTSTPSVSIFSTATGERENTKTVSAATMNKSSSLQAMTNQARGTPLPSASSVKTEIKRFNITNVLFKSTPTESLLNITGTIVMHTDSVNSTGVNVLAYKNITSQTTGSPTWLVALLIFVMLNLY